MPFPGSCRSTFTMNAQSISQQEDWLRLKGKQLGQFAEILAGRLGAHIPQSVPPQAHAPLVGFVTPVAFEYVRRAVLRDTRLSGYEQLQLTLRALGTYEYLHRCFGGVAPAPQEFRSMAIPPDLPAVSSAFATRMARVRPLFDQCLAQAKLHTESNEEDQAFAIAYLLQQMTILSAAGLDHVPDAEHAGELVATFETVGEMVERALANYAP